MKEVIYTAIFIILALILGIVVFFMFGPGKGKLSSSGAVHKYKPGVYTSSIELNSNTFDVEVTVDADSIQSIHLVNLSESTAAMFPLMEPALESLANIQYAEDQKYTSMMLLDSIADALKKAENP